MSLNVTPQAAAPRVRTGRAWAAAAEYADAVRAAEQHLAAGATAGAGSGRTSTGSGQRATAATIGAPPGSLTPDGAPRLRQVPPTTWFRDRGATGTTYYSGFLAGEEYLAELQGLQGIQTYTKMFKSDGTARAVEKALILPLLAAQWRALPASDKPRDVEIAKFVEYNFYNMLHTWSVTLRHILFMLRYGHSVMEKVWEERGGQYCYRKWGPRLPQTIYRWYFDEEGEPVGIQQRVWRPEKSGFGVIAVGKYDYIDIERERLILFAHDREGSNYLGESIGRPMYKHWWLKNNTERIMSIGVERREVGIEYAHMKEEASDEDAQNVQDSLMRLHAHEKGFLILPWTVEEAGIFGQGGTSTRQSSSMLFLEFQKREMAVSALAEFLAMGQGASGGLSQHRDKTSFFLMGLRYIADNICDTINKEAIRPLVDYNYPGVTEYPRWTCSRLETRELNTFVDAVVKLMAAGALTNRRIIQEAARAELNLPEMTAEEVDQINMEEEQERQAAAEERKLRIAGMQVGNEASAAEVEAYRKGLGGISPTKRGKPPASRPASQSGPSTPTKAARKSTKEQAA